MKEARDSAWDFALNLAASEGAAFDEKNPTTG